MADLEVNVQSIKSMRSSLQELVDQLDGMLDDMYQSVEELHQTWDGPNHIEFTSRFENRHANMKDMDKSLSSFVKAIKKAQSLYGQCEEEVWNIVRGM